MSTDDIRIPNTDDTDGDDPGTLARKRATRNMNTAAAGVAEVAAAVGVDPTAALRQGLEAQHPGDVYSTDELTERFEVLGFAAPCVVVRRRADGKKGSLFFTHQPRLFFGFKEA